MAMQSVDPELARTTGSLNTGQNWHVFGFLKISETKPIWCRHPNRGPKPWHPTESRVLSSAELSRLWRKHAAALLLIARGYCGRIADGSAEDCVQEAFIRLARQHPAPNACAAWLMTTVRNAAIDAVRNQQRRVAREQKVARERPAWLLPNDQTDAESRLAEELQAALQILDNVTRDIVVAHLWNDMTFRQIADVFDMSSATTHRKYESGIAQLQSYLAADGQPKISAVSTNT